MDSFNSMKTKLEATGLYHVEQGNNVYAELMAYAEAVDCLNEQLEIMLREMFIDTAQDYGIDLREVLLGKIKNEFPLEKRKRMLVANEQKMGGKCTLSAFEMIIRGYGVDDFYIAESPLRSKVGIIINDNLSDAHKSYIEKQIENDFPTHLDVIINYK